MRILKSHPILGLMNSYMVDSPQPASISYMWNFGSLLGACLIIQIVTGITLAMHYTPNIDLAFVSVEHIMRDVHYGWLIRYLHANTASFFFIFVYIHIGRGLYYGSYRSPRVLLWSIGVIILVLMIITGFLGYVLPYGQMSLWGATVITNLMSAIPWIGQDVVQFLWGGFSVNNATLNRFFSLHYLLPFILAALAAMHLLALHEHGSSNPLGVSGNTDRLPFHPYFVFKDLVTIFLFLLVLSAVVFYAPNMMGHSDNYIPANPMQTPPSIVPEWYLLPFYAILRSIPNKLLGVVAMLASLLILLAMPIVDTSRVRGSQFRPLMRWAFWLFVSNFMILMFIGSQHVEEPFITIGAVSTGFYFAWFLILVPVIGIVENTLLDIATDRNSSLSPVEPNHYILWFILLILFLLLWTLLSSPLLCAEKNIPGSVINNVTIKANTLGQSLNLAGNTGLLVAAFIAGLTVAKSVKGPALLKLVSGAGTFIATTGAIAIARKTITFQAPIPQDLSAKAIMANKLQISINPNTLNATTSQMFDSQGIFSIDLSIYNSIATLPLSLLLISAPITFIISGYSIPRIKPAVVISSVLSSKVYLDPSTVQLHANIHFGLLYVFIGWLITSVIILLSFYTSQHEKSLQTRYPEWPRLLTYVTSVIKIRNYVFYLFAFMIIPELLIGIYGISLLIKYPLGIKLAFFYLL